MDAQSISNGEIIDPAAYEATVAAGGRPLMPRQEPKKPRSRWPDVIGSGIAAFFLVFFLQTIWSIQHPDNRMRGVVQDEYKRPIAGAMLHVRDAEGRDLDAATTDADGLVIWKKEWFQPGITFGDYGVTRLMRASGARDHVYLSPLVPHQVRVKNAVTGLVEPDLELETYPDAETYSYIGSHDERSTIQTNAKGEALIGLLPSTARMTFHSTNKQFMVWNVLSKNYTSNVAPYQKIVHYDMTVIPTGTIEGQVVYPDGTPAKDEGSVTVTRVDPKPEPGRRWQWNRNTQQDGTFRFGGLMPGRYHVSYEAASGDVSVLSGQTVALDLPLRVSRPAAVR